MARRPVAFFDFASITAVLDAAETEDDRKAVFGLVGQLMTDELGALERNPEQHRPPEIRIERHPVQ